MLRTLLLLIAIVALFAQAEKEIAQCNQKEIELRIAKGECSKATAFELSTRKTKNTREAEYNKAVTQYDFAYAQWQVASKEELAAKTAHHTDVAVLASIRATEERLCNKLVRNVENGTPCAHLLQRARENNRLHQCREAKKTLEISIKREASSKLVFERLHKIALDKKAAKIALLRLRDEAFERFKSARAVWTMRHTTQTSTCTRYNSLKIIFHGRAVVRTTRKCKTVNECVAFKLRCLEERTIKVCSNFVYKSTCVSTVNGVCRAYRTTFECTNYRDVKNCIRNGLTCTSRKDKQICARVFRRSRVQGPSSCSASEQLAFRKEGSVLVRFCKKRENDNRRDVVCQSTYDPYVYTFKRQGISMSSEGDYELYASYDGSVEVHNRQSMFSHYAVTVNTKVAVLVNGVDLVTYECKSRLFTVNGASMVAQNKQLANGGSVKVTGTAIDIFAPNGDKILIRVNGQGENCWINNYVYSKNTNGGGLCYAEAKDADKYRITGLFKHFELPHESRAAISGAQDQIKQQIPAALRASARSACNIPKLPSQLKKQCEDDWLLSKDSFRNTVIRGYEQMINDELRGNLDNRNFF